MTFLHVYCFLNGRTGKNSPDTKSIHTQRVDGGLQKRRTFWLREMCNLFLSGEGVGDRCGKMKERDSNWLNPWNIFTLLWHEQKNTGEQFYIVGVQSRYTWYIVWFTSKKIIKWRKVSINKIKMFIKRQTSQVNWTVHKRIHNLLEPSH